MTDFDLDFREQGPFGIPGSALNEALPHLRRPFAPAAVKWKVQAARQGWGTVIAYIDVRLVVERLNLVVGAGWSDEYAARAQGVEECALTVFGVTRRDVGKGGGIETEKAARSDALKRAAVKFGIGQSIYALKAVELRATSEWASDAERLLIANKKTTKGNRDVWSARMSPAAEAYLAALYGRWLSDATDGRTTGAELFGPALDHGDEAGAAGVEGADEAVASSAVEESEPAASAQIAGEVADAHRAAATESYQAIRKMNAAAIPPKQFRVELEAAGATSLEALEAYAGKLAGIRANMEQERAK